MKSGCRAWLSAWWGGGAKPPRPPRDKRGGPDGKYEDDGEEEPKNGSQVVLLGKANGGGVARVLGATAIVDDKDAPRVRLYDVRDGRLEAAGLVTG